MKIWVYDLKTLTYSFESKNGFLNIYSEGGELIVSRKSKKNESKQEQIFQGLDCALKDSKQVRATDIYKIAFFNPYSKQIAIDGTPKTIVYQCEDDMEIKKAGVGAELVNGVLEMDGLELLPAELSISQVVRAIKAHQIA